jgi:hypothetical protein
MDTYDVVKVNRPHDDEFTAIIVGFCDTREIVTLLQYMEDHPLGAGWFERYASIHIRTFEGVR